jgi:hypothetical protein
MKFLGITISFLLSIAPLAHLFAEDLVINEVMASNITAQMNPDKSDFVDWIELYNKGSNPINLNGLFVTDDLYDPFKWQLNEDATLDPHAYYVIWADGLNHGNHTSFKLSGDGEQVGLYHEDGSVIDTLSFGVQRNDVSYGRYPDGGSEWFYFATPTCQASNSASGLDSHEQVSRPEFTLEGGFYSGPQGIHLSSVPGSFIRYTLDGSIPTTDSEVYDGPLQISETTVVRARGYQENLLPSDVVTSTYVIDEPGSLPVISIATPPEFLFDEEIGITVGICVPDNHGEPGGEPPFDPNANFWNRWERPVHIGYYTPEGAEGFAQDAGIAIFGGALGRQLRQKAFTLFARNKYGDSDFDFPLFPSKPINSYRRFILRASSNDFNRTFLRDAMMQTLVIGQMDVDYQAYQPVTVYINGQYWGLYNMREKTNQFYAEHNHGIVADSVDLVEGIAHTAHGDGGSYLALLDFVSTNDMTSSANYDHVKTQMDVTEFMNYFITEIYVCNHDWLVQNIKCWRDHGPGGKWRWLLYDLDWGFSGEFVWKSEDYKDNTFQWVQEQGDASLLFRMLMANEAFRFEFIQRFATHLNLTFNPDRVLHTIETMADRIAPEIPRQIERWEALRSVEYWHEQLDILNAFAINRPSYITDYLDEMYMMDGKSQLVLEVSGKESGWITVFDTPVPSPTYSGSWHEGIDIEIEAHAKPGWKFVEWTGDIQSQEAAVTTGFLGDAVLHARFEPHELPSVMISEIHYNPSADLQGEDEDYEFLELFNYEKEQVDLSGYKFTEGITHTFPEGSYINPGEFLLLVSNPIVYEHSVARYYQITGGRLDNAGEMLILRDAENYIIDQVHFDDHYPWPREPDGDGPSLELQSPRLDNALASSWQASQVKGGSPGFGPFTSVKEGEPYAGNELQIDVFPNPFHVTANIRYSLKEECLISMRIINMIGQEVYQLGITKQPPGDHQVIWRPQNLPGGIYFIQFGWDGNMQSRKVIYLGKANF